MEQNPKGKLQEANERMIIIDLSTYHFLSSHLHVSI